MQQCLLKKQPCRMMRFDAESCLSVFRHLFDELWWKNTFNVSGARHCNAERHKMFCIDLVNHIWYQKMQ